ncbi:MAG: transcriptional repressor NrdR [Gammaproteobacteria bacterium]|nr:transcriptional repressor NrdR [Gammaproteobacteria bacterium]
MRCPYCGAHETKVVDSRVAGDMDQIRRRRACEECGDRFTTFETAELTMPRVVKANGAREAFDETKLRAGIQTALEKRPVSVNDIETAISRIKRSIVRLGEREISARIVGDLVMEQLRNLDEVGYIRFASVYKSFQDAEEFREVLELLQRNPGQKTDSQLRLIEDAVAATKGSKS